MKGGMPYSCSRAVHTWPTSLQPLHSLTDPIISPFYHAIHPSLPILFSAINFHLLPTAFLLFSSGDSSTFHFIYLFFFVGAFYFLQVVQHKIFRDFRPFVYHYLFHSPFSFQNGLISHPDSLSSTLLLHCECSSSHMKACDDNDEDDDSGHGELMVMTVINNSNEKKNIITLRFEK